MAKYAVELPRAFQAFYHAEPVLQAENGAMRQARLRLTGAVKVTLTNSLALLGIESPDVM